VIQGLLLAAGNSSRFGANKLLHPLADGVPVGLAAARHLAAALGEVLVVVRPEDAALIRLLETAALGRVVRCAESYQGMGHSLACGVSVTPTADGWVVALADMPYVRPASIREVARRLASGASIAAPVYRGQRGHPVGFAAGFYGDLVALRGDSGARPLIERHRDRAVLFAWDDPGTVYDLDRPEDLIGE
jgi:molybdenum cofactor cytidylyltransferase